jgi:hypothetical protein
MLPYIALTKMTAHVAGDDRAVQGVQAVLPQGTYFFSFGGCAIVLGDAMQRGYGGWHNNDASNMKKPGTRVSSDKIWQFTDGVYRKVSADGIDPLLHNVIASIALGVLPTYTSPPILNKKPLPSLLNAPALIAPLPLWDQYSILQVCAKLKALKNTILMIVGDREETAHKDRKKKYAGLLRYRAPDTPPHTAHGLGDQIYLVSGLLANAFSTRWCYAPYAARTYTADFDALIATHLNKIMLVDARAWDLYNMYLERGRSLLAGTNKHKKRAATNNEAHPAELCLLRCALKSGHGDLLNHPDVWATSLAGRASFYLHQVNGFVASKAGVRSGILIPQYLLYAVGMAYPTAKPTKVSQKSLAAWHESVVLYLTALGAVALPPGTPYVPMPDVSPAVRPALPPTPTNREKMEKNRAKQYCLADLKTRFEIANQWQGVANAIARNDAAKAKRCELAAGKLSVQLQNPPEIIVCQPPTPGQIRA